MGGREANYHLIVALCGREESLWLAKSGGRLSAGQIKLCGGLKAVGKQMGAIQGEADTLRGRSAHISFLSKESRTRTTTCWLHSLWEKEVKYGRQWTFVIKSMWTARFLHLLVLACCDGSKKMTERDQEVLAFTNISQRSRRVHLS